MRRHILGVLSILCAAAANAALAQTQGVSGTEVVVGTHQDLSGPLSFLGTQAVNGMRIRFDEENEKGGIHGRKVRFIAADTQFNPARAAQAANKLLHGDKVFAIIGGLGTTNQAIVSNEAFKIGVPSLFPYAAGRQTYEPFHKLKFAAFPTHYDNVRASVKYAAEKMAKKRICALVQDNETGAEVAASATDQLKAMNMSLVLEMKHKPADKDFSAQIARLRDANCDLVVLGAIINDTILPMATARRVGWDVTFLGSSSSFGAEIIRLANGATEGLYATNFIGIPDEDSPDASVRAWRQRYKAAFGTDADYYAAIGYTISDLFVTAAQRAGKELTVDSLVNAIEGIKNYRSPFGGPPYSFGPDRHLGTQHVALFRIENGRWKMLETEIGH